MLKCLSIKAVAGALFALASSCAYYARAGESVSNEVFSSGTSFENFSTGAFNPVQSDEGDPWGPYHWYAQYTNDVGNIVSYNAGEAYDYAAHGLTRHAYLTNVEKTVTRYLGVSSVQGVSRSIFRREQTYDAFSNVVVRAGTREDIYCDLLTQFTYSEEEPQPDGSERLVVWVRLRETEHGETLTNLMLTAGYCTNSLKSVATRHYCLDTSEFCPEGFDLSRWYRLTIRAHGNAFAYETGALPSCFTLYLDGRPLRPVADEYAICDTPARLAQRFRPEARALVADRRLFLGLTVPGSDASRTVSGFTFVGDGKVDDVTFSSDDPGYGAAETVFTLSWDSGVTLLKYTLDGGLTTNEAPVSTAQRADILLGSAATNGLALKVLACAYDTAGGFAPGVWAGSNGALATNVNATATAGEFVFDGTTRNPVASVASARDTLDIGGIGKFLSFRSAFAAMDGGKTNVLRLLSDCTVSTKVDAYGLSDQGYVLASNPEGEYVLDLNGHTLRGASGKNPTLVVNCRSFRICDTSAEKTGRILPVGSNEDAETRLNTAVLVYPAVMAGDSFVEPVLTLQGGTYDGWVRNQPNVGAESASVGTVYVEGGSYISTNAVSFYLGSCVTNPVLRYAYRSGYWIARAETNLVEWTGLGDGRRWLDPANWENGCVPTANEAALFPTRAEAEGPWTVDVETNAMTTKTLALEGDVALFGTNDFVGVKLLSGGLGRLSGDALLVYEGEQPGDLAGTLLADDWAGTVLVKNLGYASSARKAPQVLKNIETWGVAGSTVVFNGVRGYVMDVNSHTMPYDFVLRDLVVGTVTNAAWQNDSGYTGSTLAFRGALSGDGEFRSGANARAIFQLFKFEDTEDFRGKFTVNGKRVLVGKTANLQAKAGLLAFGEEAVVAADLGWTCRSATFGGGLHVLGDTNGVLVTCCIPSGKADEPDVSCCTNVTLNGEEGVAWLATTNTVTEARPSWNVYVTGERPAAASLNAFNDIPVALASSFSAATTLACASVAAESVDVSIEMTETEVRVVVANAVPGLWYAVRHRAFLSDGWTEPSSADWQRATGSTVTLVSPRSAASGYYSVVVAGEDPTGGEQP